MCSEPAERLEITTSTIFTPNSRTDKLRPRDGALEQHEAIDVFLSGDGVQNPPQNNERPSHLYNLDTPFSGSGVEPIFHGLIQKANLSERCRRELHVAVVRAGYERGDMDLIGENGRGHPMASN
jgi:hypothetical protein